MRWPLLQTNDARYRNGESVVFVGQVYGEPAAAPDYRDGKSSGVNLFSADIAWRVYQVATRSELARELQQQEMSWIPVMVGVLLLLCALALTMVTFVRY